MIEININTADKLYGTGGIKYSSAGLLFLYYYGYRSGDKMELYHIDTNQYLMGEFCDQVKEEAIGDLDVDCVEGFCVVGVPEKVTLVKEAIIAGVQNNFERFIEGKPLCESDAALDPTANEFYALVQEYILNEERVLYPRVYDIDVGNWDLCCIYGAKGPEDDRSLLVESAIAIWQDIERPFLLGRQLVNQSFLLRDTVGRKVIGTMPDHENHSWYLILEGGTKVRLQEDVPYVREKAGVRDFGLFTSGDIDGILNNPIYAYGIFCDPQILYEEWKKVFVFAAALTPANWDRTSLMPVYESFLEFIQENICETMLAEPLIDKEVFYNALIKNIEKIRSFLTGEDEPIISKDILLLLNSRYIYLPYIYPLFESFQSEKEASEFSPSELKRRIIMASEKENSYEKGLCWERAVEYVIQHIPGLRISGRRVKATHLEIDLSVVNVSLDSRLWEMGAYILVECKNWKGKVGLPEIRNLAHIANMKGNKTTLLFSVNAVTGPAKEEIVRLAVNGTFILCINKSEISCLETPEDAYTLLLEKWDNLQQIVENEFAI